MAADHIQPVGVAAGGAGRDIGGPIISVVVDPDDGPPTGVILAPPRADAGGDDFRLVARRNHGDHARPCRGRRRLLVIPLGIEPEGPPGEDEIEPDRQCDRRKHQTQHALSTLHRSSCRRHGPRLRNRARKNNSTYSMNWVRRSWTASGPRLDSNGSRRKAWPAV